MRELGIPPSLLAGQALFLVGFGVMMLFFFQPWRSCPEGACAPTPMNTVGFVVGAVVGTIGLVVTVSSVVGMNRRR